MKNIVAVIEEHKNQIDDAGIFLLETASKLATEMQAVLKVEILKDVQSIQVREYAAALRKVIQAQEPSVYLLPATQFGNELASMTAIGLGEVCGLICDAAEISSIRKDTGKTGVSIRRLATDGRSVTVYECKEDTVQLVTVKPQKPQWNTVEDEGWNKKSGVENLPAAEVIKSGKMAKAELYDTGLKMKETGLTTEQLLIQKYAVQLLDKAEEKQILFPVIIKDTPEILCDYTENTEVLDIEHADYVFSGGRGIGGKEGYQKLEELAAACGAKTSTSRANVDEGWISKERQVGLSGKIIAPKVYFAVGISGAAHHVIGIENAETVIAVNLDRNAPIFDVADLGIVADGQKVIERLLQLMK